MRSLVTRRLKICGKLYRFAAVICGCSVADLTEGTLAGPLPKVHTRRIGEMRPKSWSIDMNCQAAAREKVYIELVHQRKSSKTRIRLREFADLGSGPTMVTLQRRQNKARFTR